MKKLAFFFYTIAVLSAVAGIAAIAYPIIQMNIPRYIGIFSCGIGSIINAWFCYALNCALEEIINKNK